jgi:lysophospholipase L1-like esterase
MRPIILSVINGSIFFVGLALVLIGELPLIRFRNKIARSVLTAIAMLGVISVVVSAVPLPLWAYSIWTTLTITASVALCRAATPAKTRRFIGVILFLATAAFAMAEGLNQRTPRISVDDGTTIYVIGDSISAGIEEDIPVWPTLLEKITSRRVVNLARPGATVEDGMTQAGGITEARAMIVIEIGGNDLLGRTDAESFHAQLDSLVAALRSSNHQILLLELPLFPFQNAFGRAQREVAARHNIALLPRRRFASVLGMPNGTIDGIHLSADGHKALAKIIAQVIEKTDD